MLALVLALVIALVIAWRAVFALVRWFVRSTAQKTEQMIGIAREAALVLVPVREVEMISGHASVLQQTEQEVGIAW